MTKNELILINARLAAENDALRHKVSALEAASTLRVSNQRALLEVAKQYAAQTHRTTRVNLGRVEVYNKDTQTWSGITP